MAVHIVGHHDLVPPDWHARLVQRLGQRPRRIGSWAELALYGARACLDAAGEDTLPPGALLCVASLLGPVEVTREAIAQSASGLPKPFSFLQSQPSQMLAALCQHLRWSGDARFMFTRDPALLMRLLQLESGPEGALLGWVEEGAEGRAPRSEWWRLRTGSTSAPAAAPSPDRR
jgi:hypothetical protein